MPIIEFVCKNGHTTEKLILSMAASEKVKTTVCAVNDCDETAHRAVVSAPGAHFAPGGVGGFHKPSAGSIASKPDPSRFAKEVFDQIGGVEGLKKNKHMMGYKPKGLSVNPHRDAKVQVKK